MNCSDICILKSTNCVIADLHFDMIFRSHWVMYNFWKEWFYILFGMSLRRFSFQDVLRWFISKRILSYTVKDMHISCAVSMFDNGFYFVFHFDLWSLSISFWLMISESQHWHWVQDNAMQIAYNATCLWRTYIVSFHFQEIAVVLSYSLQIYMLQASGKQRSTYGHHDVLL